MPALESHPVTQGGPPMTLPADTVSRSSGGKPDTAGVVALPPLVFLGSILAGLGLHRAWPLPLLPAGPHAAWGGVLIGGALVLFVLAVRELRRAGTAIQTSHPTTALVQRGPYRLSRNPIYLAFVLLKVGVAVLVDSAWVLGMAIPALGVVRYGVIAREEAYLERTFGDAYRRYAGSVRRWL
jgi:protein-S-isoprenylcysteine O-methyltransferase Ste14